MSREKTKSSLLERLSGSNTDKIIYKFFPELLMEILAKYFRLEVIGMENIPKRGPAIITPNHSGYSGFDAMILAHQIRKHTGRQPRLLTHRLWFVNKMLSIPANKLGFIEATTKNGLEILKKNQPIVIFPEGEHGNFKPTSKAYELQEFKRGFVRMALLAQAPIVPLVVLGAEETHINLHQLELPAFMKNLVLPLPLNLIPLPAKWKIVVLPPIRFPYKESAADDNELAHELADEIRDKMQKELTKLLAQRGSAFF